MMRSWSSPAIRSRVSIFWVNLEMKQGQLNVEVEQRGAGRTPT